MAKLVFLRRTENEIKIFGGDVYIDIDGKNVGQLSDSNQEFMLSAGQHTIKMYRSHIYDTFIGFAESTIAFTEKEQLMVRYEAPMATNRPCNLIISNYDPSKEIEILRAREEAIQRDYITDENRKREQNEKYNIAVIWSIVVLVVSTIIWAIWVALI